MKKLLITIMMAMLLVLAATSVVMAGSSGSIDLPWHMFGEGGITVSSGGDILLQGTIGQTATGESRGGLVSLTGGFWHANTNTTPRPFPQGVGGELEPTDKTGVLSTWIVLGLLSLTSTICLFLWMSRRYSANK